MNTKTVNPPVDYDYTDMLGGVKVTLVGFTGYDAFNELVTVYKMDALHQVLCEAVASKPSPLTPAEFKFIRVHVGMSESFFNRAVGMRNNVAMVIRRESTVSVDPESDSEIDVMYEVYVRQFVYHFYDIDPPTARTLIQYAIQATDPNHVYRIDASDPTNYKLLD